MVIMDGSRCDPIQTNAPEKLWSVTSCAVKRMSRDERNKIRRADMTKTTRPLFRLFMYEILSYLGKAVCILKRSKDLTACLRFRLQLCCCVQQMSVPFSFCQGRCERLLYRNLSVERQRCRTCRFGSVVFSIYYIMQRSGLPLQWFNNCEAICQSYFNLIAKCLQFL